MFKNKLTSTAENMFYFELLVVGFAMQSGGPSSAGGGGVQQRGTSDPRPGAIRPLMALPMNGYNQQVASAPMGFGTRGQVAHR